MERPADVVAIILHFRTPAFTVAALESLIGQGMRRAVVVDNSEDEGRSLAAMDVELSRLRGAGLHIDLVQAGCNLGFAAGVAAGVARLHEGPGRHALLLNSDAVLAPSAVDRMCRLLGDHGLVVPWICRGAGQPPSCPFDFYQPALAAITRAPLPGRSIAVASGCCMLIREDLLRRPLFDTDFFFYCEDIMLAYDLGRRQVRVTDCRDAVVMHAVSASARKGSLFYEYHIARAHWLLAAKLARSPGERLRYAALRALVLPLRALWRALRLRSWLPLRALRMASLDVLRGRCRALTPPAEV